MLYAIIFQMVSVLFGAREVPIDQVVRVSRAIEHAVEAETDLPFKGRFAKEKSAVLLGALANHESGLREEIEYCTSPRRKGWEDNGKAVGYTQLFEGVSWEHHTRAEICGDAELQFRLALRYLARSMKKCGSVSGALSDYNTNRCTPSAYSERLSIAYGRLESRFVR